MLSIDAFDQLADGWSAIRTRAVLSWLWATSIPTFTYGLFWPGRKGERFEGFLSPCR
jgi:hypothetical protein